MIFPIKIMAFYESFSFFFPFSRSASAVTSWWNFLFAQKEPTPVTDESSDSDKNSADGNGVLHFHPLLLVMMSPFESVAQFLGNI